MSSVNRATAVGEAIVGGRKSVSVAT